MPNYSHNQQAESQRNQYTVRTVDNCLVSTSTSRCVELMFMPNVCYLSVCLCRILHCDFPFNGSDNHTVLNPPHMNS